MVNNLPAIRNHGFDPWVRKMPWRRKWPHTPVFLPGEFHGQRSLAGYSPWGLKSQTQLSNSTITMKEKDKLSRMSMIVRIYFEDTLWEVVF